MPRSRSTVRIASTSEAGELRGVRDGVAGREVAPERLAAELAASTVRPRKRFRPARSTALDRLPSGGDDRLRLGVDHEPRRGAVLARVDEAARDLHRAHDLRRAGDVDLGDDRRRSRPARVAARPGRPGIGVRRVALDATTSTRSPRSSSRWPKPVERERRRSRRRRPTSITRSVRSVTAKMRVPSVLTMSGSSTSASCVLVPEKSWRDRRLGVAAGRRRCAAPTRASIGALGRAAASRRRHDRVDRRRGARVRRTPTPPSSVARRRGRSPPAYLQELNAFSRGLGAAAAASAAARARMRVTVATIRIDPTYSAFAAFGKARAIRPHARRVQSPCVWVAGARRARGDRARSGSRCARSRC